MADQTPETWFGLMAVIAPLALPQIVGLLQNRRTQGHVKYMQGKVAHVDGKVDDMGGGVERVRDQVENDHPASNLRGDIDKMTSIARETQQRIEEQSEQIRMLHGALAAEVERSKTVGRELRYRVDHPDE